VALRRIGIVLAPGSGYLTSPGKSQIGDPDHGAHEIPASFYLTPVPFFLKLQLAVAVTEARAQESAQNPASSQSAQTSQGQQAGTQQDMSSEGNTQLSTQQVANLPLNQRYFTKLLALAGATTTDTNGVPPR
jgi:hypothetical protein